MAPQPPAPSPDKPATDAGKWRLAALGLGAIILIYLAFHLLGLRVTSDEADGEAEVAGGSPVEFLYLDTGRVSSYAAQVSGGTFDEQKVTRKLTDSVNAKVVLTGLGEGGGSRAREVFLERVLKPTDASSFFALEDSLEGMEDELEEVGLREIARVEGLEEGQMIRFETESLLSPLYLNPYLAVRQANTLEAIFPDSAARRTAAKAFYGDVGKNPRVVFALRPAQRGEPAGQRVPFKYLLPMTANGLSKERSLFKNGGGRFTVVGKVVRIFSAEGPKASVAYVDSPTLETWEQPLLKAPGELLCRTERQCIENLREADDPSGRERRDEIRAARARITRALKRQTTIPEGGAVILPVAIYK
jgi:hypothetical protein